MIILIAPFAAHGGEFLPGGNSGALARGFALPELGRGQVLEGARYEIRTLLDITSEFVAEPVGGCGAGAECVLLDGETTRLLLTYRRGLGAGWDVSAEVPVLSQGGGFLDSWIENWHDWFGLPDGGRKTPPRDQYAYSYKPANTGMPTLNVTESYSGFGDISFGLGKRLSDSVALRGLVKLPTGDDEKLGGGNAGAALWLDAALPLPEDFHGFAAGGVSVNDRGKVLPDMQNREVFFGGVGFTTPVPFTDRVRLVAQLQGHSKLYDGSDLTPFSRFGLPLTLGLQVRTGAMSRFEFGFQEDLSVNASPDFSAYVAFTVSPR